MSEQKTQTETQHINSFDAKIEELYVEMVRIACERISLPEGDPQRLTVPEKFRADPLEATTQKISLIVREYEKITEALINLTKYTVLEELLLIALVELSAMVTREISSIKARELSDIEEHLESYGIIKVNNQTYKKSVIGVLKEVVEVLEEKGFALKETFMQRCKYRDENVHPLDQSSLNSNWSFLQILEEVRNRYQPQDQSSGVNRLGAKRMQAYDDTKDKIVDELRKTNHDDESGRETKDDTHSVVLQCVSGLLVLNTSIMDMDNYLVQADHVRLSVEDPGKVFGHRLAFAAFLTDLGVKKLESYMTILGLSHVMAVRFYSALPAYDTLANYVVHESDSFVLIDAHWSVYEGTRFFMADTDRYRLVQSLEKIVASADEDDFKNGGKKTLLDYIAREKDFVENTLPLLMLHPGFYEHMQKKRAEIAEEKNQLEHIHKNIQSEKVDNALHLILNEVARGNIGAMDFVRKHNYISQLLQDPYRIHFLLLVNFGCLDQKQSEEWVKTLIRAAEKKQGQVYLMEYCRYDNEHAEEARNFLNTQDVHFSSKDERSTAVFRREFIFMYLMDEFLDAQKNLEELCRTLMEHPLLLSQFFCVLILGDKKFQTLLPASDVADGRGDTGQWHQFLLSKPHQTIKKILIEAYLRSTLLYTQPIFSPTISLLQFAKKAAIDEVFIADFINGYLNHTADAQLTKCKAVSATDSFLKVLLELKIYVAQDQTLSKKLELFIRSAMLCKAEQISLEAKQILSELRNVLPNAGVEGGNIEEKKEDDVVSVVGLDIDSIEKNFVARILMIEALVKSKQPREIEQILSTIASLKEMMDMAERCLKAVPVQKKIAVLIERFRSLTALSQENISDSDVQEHIENLRAIIKTINTAVQTGQSGGDNFNQVMFDAKRTMAVADDFLIAPQKSLGVAVTKRDGFFRRRNWKVFPASKRRLSAPPPVDRNILSPNQDVANTLQEDDFVLVTAQPVKSSPDIVRQRAATVVRETTHSQTRNQHRLFALGFSPLPSHSLKPASGKTLLLSSTLN